MVVARLIGVVRAEDGVVAEACASGVLVGISLIEWDSDDPGPVCVSILPLVVQKHYHLLRICNILLRFVLFPLVTRFNMA